MYILHITYYISTTFLNSISCHSTQWGVSLHAPFAGHHDRRNLHHAFGHWRYPGASDGAVGGEVFKSTESLEDQELLSSLWSVLWISESNPNSTHISAWLHLCVFFVLLGQGVLNGAKWWYLFDLSGSFEEPRQLDGGCVQHLATDARKGREPHRGPAWEMPLFQRKAAESNDERVAPLLHGWLLIMYAVKSVVPFSNSSMLFQINRTGKGQLQLRCCEGVRRINLVTYT